MTRGPVQVARAGRAAAAIKLRTAGMSYDQIGENLGLTRQTAWRMATKALRQLPAENVETLRRVEGDRLEALWAAFYPKAISGDADAAGVLLRISNSRRRLFGLDAAGPVDGGRATVVQQIVISAALALDPSAARPYMPTPIEPPPPKLLADDLGDERHDDIFDADPS